MLIKLWDKTDKHSTMTSPVYNHLGENHQDELLKKRCDRQSQLHFLQSQE